MMGFFIFISMRLIKLAKFLYRNVGDSNTSTLYEQLFKDNIFEPLLRSVTPQEIIKIIFLASEIGNNGNPEELLTKLNNLYIFSIISFGDDENWIECESCFGNRVVECGDCSGRGYFDCEQCDGGDVRCDTCDGYGKLEDGETCPDCDGEGNNKCEYCDGEGEYECEYCYGTGQNDCPDCGGEGEIETDEYVPYNIFLYASYDTNLRTSLERSMVRNVEFLTAPTSNKTFYIYIESVNAGDGDSGLIDHKYKNTDFVNGVDEIDNLVISKEGKKIKDFNLLLPDNRFYD